MNDQEYKKIQRDNKRRISYLLLLLLLTGTFLSTSTYAWFTTNKVVSVSMINVKVQTEGSLEISADGTNFKPGITEEEIIGAHSGNYPNSVNQLPAYIEQVSTVGNLDNRGFMEMFFGNIDSNDNGDYIIISEKSTETESNGVESDGKFVAFDIFLRTSTTKDLYLTNESKVIYNGERSTGIENAIRVAFVVEGNTRSDSGLNTIQNLTTTDKNNVYIWEPNYNTHTVTGISHASGVYGLTIAENNAERISYDGIKSVFSKDDNITFSKANSTNYPNYFEEVTPKILTVKNEENYQYFINLQEGVTKVRVYLWLEGQDVDCENGASVGDLSFGLQFSTNPA